MTPSTSDGTAPASGPEPVPVCPRHRDRESWVRCQRCERPVCPQCQRPAAVGVQCVDCVREGARSIRQARTIFGGRVTEGRPLVTLSIMGICLVAFAIDWLGVLPLTQWWMFVPGYALSDPESFVLSGFLHSTSFLPHILFNLYALWLVGPFLEKAFGRWRFAALYGLAIIGGSAVDLALASPTSDAWLTGAVGASGAVFGLWGALFFVQRRLGANTTQLTGVIAINAVLGFVIPNVAWQAHLGGLLTGLLIGALFTQVPRGRNSLGHVAGVVGVALLLVAVVAVKVALVPSGSWYS